MDSYSQLSQTPLELDHLVHTLRHPSPGVTVQQILGYLYNYLPYVKHEHNLKLVFSSFLNNPVCYGLHVPSFEANYLVVEVFKLATDKKLKVSQPTLPLKTYYEVLLRELQNFVRFNPVQNSWKVLPIIAGMWLSNDLRDSLYTDVNVLQYKWFFNDWDAATDTLFKRCLQHSLYGAVDPQIAYLSLLSLALKCRYGESLKDYVGPLHPRLLIVQLMDMIYGPDGGANAFREFDKTGPHDPNLEGTIRDKVLQKPVVKHLNKLSYLLEQLLEHLPGDVESFDLIMSVVTRLLEFSTEINHFTTAHPMLNVSTDTLTENDIYQQQFWLLMKNFLFSQVIIFQGVLSRFMSAKNVSFFSQYLSPSRRVSRMEAEYTDICRNILHTLYYLNFVLMSVGQGGFDGYNFVYYVCLELCLQNNNRGTFEMFTKYLIGNFQEVNLHHEALNRNYVALTKVLFVFGLWENYLQQLKTSGQTDTKFARHIYNVTVGLVGNPYLVTTSIIESGHSVLLVYFSNMENTNQNLHEVLRYFELLASQFPRLLSANQLSVAVETLGKKILSNPFPNKPGSLYKTSAEEFLEFVFFKCSSTRSGQPITRPNENTFASAQPISEIEAASTMKQLKRTTDLNVDIVKRNKKKTPKDLAGLGLVNNGSKEPMQHFAVREAPETSREGIIVAFLNVIPYLPMSSLVHWLNKIWRLIEESNQEERKFLRYKMWEVIGGSLDLNRCEIAYVWWYEKKRAAEGNGPASEISKL